MTKRKPAVANETFGNGARIVWVDYPWRKWSIFDAYGTHHGWRTDIGQARELAASLPGQPLIPDPPRVIPRSPRAMPLGAEKFLPTGPRPDERAEEAWRPPAVIEAYPHAKALSRRHYR